MFGTKRLPFTSPQCGIVVKRDLAQSGGNPDHSGNETDRRNAG
jgi:hypothetical protein